MTRAIAEVRPSRARLSSLTKSRYLVPGERSRSLADTIQAEVIQSETGGAALRTGLSRARWNRALPTVQHLRYVGEVLFQIDVHVHNHGDSMIVHGRGAVAKVKNCIDDAGIPIDVGSLDDLDVAGLAVLVDGE